MDILGICRDSGKENGSYYLEFQKGLGWELWYNLTLRGLPN